MGLFRACIAAVVVLFFVGQKQAAAENSYHTSIEDFVRDPAVSGISLSPNGMRLAYEALENGTRHIVVADVAPDGITETHRHPVADDLNAVGAFWISDDRLFGYDVRFKGRVPLLEEEPFVTAWVMSADGSDKKILWEEAPNPNRKKRKKGRIRKPSHKVSFGLMHSLPHEPDFVLVTRVEETPDRKDDRELDVVSDIFKMNIRTGEMTDVTPKHGIDGARMFAWTADKDGVIRMGYGEVGKDEDPVLLIRKDADSEWTRLHDNDLFKRGKFFPMAIGADADIMYVRSSLATGRSAIYRFSLKRGRLKGKVFAHDKVNAGGIFFTDDDAGIAAVSYYDDEYRLEVFDEAFQARLDAISAAVGSPSFRLGESTDDRARQIIWVGDERSLRKPWIFFEESESAVALPDRTPWIDPAKMAPMASITYRARDGVEIPGYLTLPTTTDKPEKLPAIIMPHGGPHVRDYKNWDHWVQFLASRGYAVLQPNFRGSTGFGDRFFLLGFGQYGDDMQQDVTDGANWLIKEGIADPERICIMGGSYGGYAALMALVQDSDLFRCGIAWAPVTDQKTLLKQINSWDKDTTAYWQLTGGKSGKELKEISPLYQANKITRPLLLMHGDQDDVVFIDQSRLLMKALKRRKKPAETVYLEFPGIGHHLETAEARARLLRETEQFLMAHNPPNSTSTASAAQ